MSSANEAQFRNTLVATGLVTPSQLEYVVRLARHRQSLENGATAKPAPDRLIADLLVEQSVLTPYQAEQLCAGRTKLNLGSYVITDWIGQGGMGQVFKGVHQLLKRECAIKVLPLARLTEEARASFLREIRMQAQLDCDYLVRAFDAGQDGKIHYLVTEYVPGMDLRRLVKTRGPLPIHQAASIVKQAAIGLSYAHGQGMVHRDVKPGNILVTPEGTAKVSDIGLAGFAEDLMDDPRAGKIVGTADFLSPEQIRTPLNVGPASDIYALGCTLYYAICGKPPFPGGDTKSKICRHLEEQPWHPRRFVPNLNEEFIDIVADMMEKDVHERIQTANEVASRLEVWAGDAGDLTSGRMLRGPWINPPAPSVDADSFGSSDPNPFKPAVQDGSSDESSRNLDASVPALDLSHASDMGSLSDKSMIPPVISTHLATAKSRYSSGMLISMTVAIVLPPALLVGAILGFLVRHYR